MCHEQDAQQAGCKVCHRSCCHVRKCNRGFKKLLTCCPCLLRQPHAQAQPRCLSLWLESRGGGGGGGGRWDREGGREGKREEDGRRGGGGGGNEYPPDGSWSLYSEDLELMTTISWRKCGSLMPSAAAPAASLLCRRNTKTPGTCHDKTVSASNQHVQAYMLPEICALSAMKCEMK